MQKIKVFYFLVLSLFLINFITASIHGQSTYSYDVIATSSGSLEVYPAPSINNNGEISFAGRYTAGGGAIFTDHLPNSPKDLLTNFSSLSFWATSGHTQINDSRQILSLWIATNTTPNQNWLRIIDGTQPMPR